MSPDMMHLFYFLDLVRYNLSMKPASSFTPFTKKLRKQLPTIKAKYHLDTVQLFGSYVRNEQTPTSDLDILVTFTETPSLLEFIALENELSDLLGVKVDLVMKNTLKPPLQKIILEEAVPV